MAREKDVILRRDYDKNEYERTKEDMDDGDGAVVHDDGISSDGRFDSVAKRLY